MWFRLLVLLLTSIVATDSVAVETVDDVTRAEWAKSLERSAAAAGEPQARRSPLCRRSPSMRKPWNGSRDTTSFIKPDYLKWTTEALERGTQRAEALAGNDAPWMHRPGQTTVLGYVSDLDGSTQPYAVTLPMTFEAKSRDKWPLHLVLHGRGDTLNEVSFLHQHEGKPLKNDIAWIQLDVFGRTNNAYRWAGETDVFEALAAVKRRLSDRRKAASPSGGSRWAEPERLASRLASSRSMVVGRRGSGVLRYRELSESEGAAVAVAYRSSFESMIAVDYTLNAANVPIIGYGGELDKQLLAAKTMQSRKLRNLEYRFRCSSVRRPSTSSTRTVGRSSSRSILTPRSAAVRSSPARRRFASRPARSSTTRASG